ncbi:hypothetical protein Tco_0770316 [Tanacetum coccineum]|uniref:Reverse transcriptase domain-containing protein n=1 Tax=Tanacetum coccineum TaxID=301880 RepID=A0ABQ4ZCX8_9ASTR
MNCPVVVEAMIEGFRVRRIHVDGGSSSEVMYEHCFRSLSYRTRGMRENPNGHNGVCGGQESVPYNALLGRTGMRSLGAVASTIHSMMKFPTSNGIATISTTRETLRECRQIEEAQDLSRHARVTDPTPMQTSSEVANPRLSLAPVETRPRRPGKEPMQLDGTEGRQKLDKGRRLPKSSVEEKINVDIFAWTTANMTSIPKAITDHILNTYPHIKPKAQKKRSLAPDRRKVVTGEVNEWLMAGIVRRVRYPTWVANPVLVKKVDGSWRMCIDFKDLNKACPKDLYPLSEIDWKIESLMGFQYKCFLDAYKGYHQIQMTKKDEEKTAFHTEEGVFCYTKMPFGLKNARVNDAGVLAFECALHVDARGSINPESDKWLNAMNVEMQSMRDNKVWELVDLPPNGKIVGTNGSLKRRPTWMERLGVVPTIEEPINMYCDNTGAIAIAKYHGVAKGARHFRAKVHYLRETIEMGDVRIEKLT